MFVKIFAFCVCMLAMLAAPGATMLGIYYGNDGPNAPCSADVPRWFFVTGCVSASMAGSILVLILAMGLSFFCPECGGAKPRDARHFGTIEGGRNMVGGSVKDTASGIMLVTYC